MIWNKSKACFSFQLFIQFHLKEINHIWYIVFLTDLFIQRDGLQSFYDFICFSLLILIKILFVVCWNETFQFCLIYNFFFKQKTISHSMQWGYAVSTYDFDCSAGLSSRSSSTQSSSNSAVSLTRAPKHTHPSLSLCFVLFCFFKYFFLPNTRKDPIICFNQ